MLGYQVRPFVRQRVPLMRLIIRRKWVFLALALLPVIAACWGIVWLTPKLKASQSGEFLKVAEHYLNTGKTREAVMSLNSSLRLVPDNPAALRLLARIQTAQGDPMALDNWNKLLATGKVQLEDVIMCAQMAANQQDWALADRLAGVTGAFGNKALPHLIRAGLLRSKGDPVAVEAELRQAVEKDETLSSKRALVKFLLSQRLSNESSKEAFEILKEVSKMQDATGSEPHSTGPPRICGLQTERARGKGAAQRPRRGHGVDVSDGRTIIGGRSFESERGHGVGDLLLCLVGCQLARGKLVCGCEKPR
jgi:tetratricopeptide (TPR) repeat protein